MTNSFVLHGDFCFSEGPDAVRVHPDSHAVCENGISRGVHAILPERYKEFPLIDRKGMLILPGLCDLHMHAPQYSFRALGMDLELLDWLRERTFPEEAKFADLSYARRAYECLVADLKAGPNTRFCIFGTLHRPATILLMELMEASGLVSMIGKVNMDRNGGKNLCEPSAEDSLSDTRRWLHETAGRFRNTTPILTPRFIPACSDTLLTGLAALQAECNLPVQSHLSENREEIAWVRKLCPESSSYADAYRRFGLFGGDVPTIMAHCAWNDDDEIDLMRQQNVFVAHCPQSNINLSSGIAPARRFLAAGVKMGLGSDLAGGCHASIFRAMSDAVQVSKIRWRLVDESERALTLEEAFWLGTAGGGSFFGKVGSFADGFEFDAVVVDDSTISTPLDLDIPERLARVVYLSDNSHIREKYVRGKLIS